MKNTEITYPLFREAVEAIDAGHIAALESLLAKYPHLISEPLDRPSGDYFQNPYLLWFVADNPIRIKTSPPNIVDVTRLLIRFVKQDATGSMQRQLDYTLGLVDTGRILRECGVQIEMIDLLIDEGAIPGGGLGALAHGNVAAAARLIERGGSLTLATAVGLDRMDDVTRLVKGAGPNGYPANNRGFHLHATPLHQAVNSGSLDCVKLLVEAGANLNAKDKAYQGTPLGWAMYMPTEEGCDETAKEKFALIEGYLREKGQILGTL